MDVTRAPLAVLLLASGLLTGCAGASVDATCDVEGITAEVEHMVEESSLRLDSLESLRCSGDWAVAGLSVSGPGATQESTVILQRSEVGWVLKSAEVACAGDDRVESIPEELADAACAIR